MITKVERSSPKGINHQVKMNPIQFGLCVGAFLFLLGCCGISTLFAFKDRIAQLDIKPLLWRRNRLWNEVESSEASPDAETGLIQSQDYRSINNGNQSPSNRNQSPFVCVFLCNTFTFTFYILRQRPKTKKKTKNKKQKQLI